jgi:hypothetical protein
MVPIGLLGLSIRLHNPYRDGPDRSELTAPIDDPSLRGVRTTSARASSVEQLLDEVRRRVGPDDLVLAYPGLPMLHWLTHTRPALENPWPKLISGEALDARLRALWDRGEPVLAVRARVDLAERRWGAADGVAPARDVEAIDRALRERGFEEVWSNREFAILTAPGFAADAPDR